MTYHGSISTTTTTTSLVNQAGVPILRRAAGVVAASLVPLPVKPWRQKTAETTDDKQKAPIQPEEKQVSKSFSLSRLIGWGLGLPSFLVYVVYPVSTLMAFRIPEQMSWLGLFQRYHRCSTANETIGCIQVFVTNLFLFGSSFGSFWYLFKFRSWKAWGAYFAVAGAAVAVVKGCVDHWNLYQPPPLDTAASSLQGKVAVITGANRGIGLATAHALAERGAHVVVTCRSMAKCQPVIDDINNRSDESKSIAGSASAAILDLSSLESAYTLSQELVAEYPEIHYVFANAGTTPQYPLTKEGYEDGFGGMHLAHMALVLGILPSLEAAGRNAADEDDPARVVVVSSEMAMNAAIGVFGQDILFSGDTDTDDWKGEETRGDGTLGPSMAAYGRAKLCGVLFALELNRRLAAEESPVIANAIHTGAVVTDSSRNSIAKAFPSMIPGLRWLVGKLYFPVLWRNVKGGSRTLLCPALSKAPYVLRGGQYLDALCRPFDHDEHPDPSKQRTISIPNLGPILLDPIQGLLLADLKWSKRLWDVSLHFLTHRNSAPFPSQILVRFCWIPFKVYCWLI